MKTSLRELGSRVESLTPPHFDAAALIRRAETRARRRRTSTLVAAGVAVALVGFGAAVLDGGDDRATPPPTKQGRTDEPTPVVPEGPVRQVVYGTGYFHSTNIHVGNHTVHLAEVLGVRPAETGIVNMDVTDEGVVFTIATIGGEGRGVWFTDGVRTRRVGRIQGYLGIRARMAVVSGTSGSRAAWMDERTGTPEIVVYDTRVQREVARVAVPVCTEYRTATCELRAIVGDSDVYLESSDLRHRRPSVLMGLDVSTGNVREVGPDDLAVDQVGEPRGLVLGEAPDTGLVTDGYVGFAVRGSRLVPEREALRPAGRPRGQQDPVSLPVRAFDTGTHQQVRFRLPDGYDAAAGYIAFEWLDDDRLLLTNGVNAWDGTNTDILACRISTGACNVVVPARPGEVRILPHIWLPG